MLAKPAVTCEPFALRSNCLAPAGAALAASASASAMLVPMWWVVLMVCLLRCGLIAGCDRLYGGGWRAAVECRLAVVGSGLGGSVLPRHVGGVESFRRCWEGVVLQFRILGPLEVMERDAPLSLGGAKQRAVLAILLLHSGEAISRERLISELWAERPPATAAKTLQGYVFHLRRALGDGLLHTRRAGYGFSFAPGQLDADEFERLAAEARVALRLR